MRPQIEYACEVWDPYLQKDCYMLEQVQKFACKVCLKRWSIPYHDMLSQLHIPSLKDRRKSMRLCTLYKIIHGFSDYPSPPLQTRISPYFSRHLHSWSLLQPFARTCQYKNSFFPNTICSWNSLPADITSSTSLNIFRHYVTDVC